MISAVRNLGCLALSTFLDIEEEYQNILRECKKTAISVLGPISTATLAISTISAAMLKLVGKSHIKYAVYVLIGGILLLSILILFGGYWTWEFLRYDFDASINPLYHEQ